MKITTDYIRSCRSWTDPSRYFPEDWSGTAEDILVHADLMAEEKLSIVLHEEFLGREVFRLALIDIMDSCKHLLGNKQICQLVDCYRDYTEGKISRDDLYTAIDKAQIILIAESPTTKTKELHAANSMHAAACESLIVSSWYARRVMALDMENSDETPQRRLEMWEESLNTAAEIQVAKLLKLIREQEGEKS